MSSVTILVERNNGPKGTWLILKEEGEKGKERWQERKKRQKEVNTKKSIYIPELTIL